MAPQPKHKPVVLNWFHNSNGSKEGLQPEILAIIPQVEAIFREKTGIKDFKVHINAGQEWHFGHKLFSLHHTGYAIDFQTIKLSGGGKGPIAQQIEHAVKTKLGGKYHVELEKNPPHLHIEFSKGLKVSNPGDFPQTNENIG